MVEVKNSLSFEAIKWEKKQKSHRAHTNSRKIEQS